MKKVLFLMVAALAIMGCNNNKKNVDIPINSIVDKYTDEQAIKAFKEAFCKDEETKKKPVCDVFFAKAEKSSLVLCFIE